MRNNFFSIFILATFFCSAQPNIQFENQYGNGNVYGGSATKDGGSILTGFVFPYAFLLKVDSVGIELWRKAYGDSVGLSPDNFGYAVIQTVDGGYLFTGQYQPYYNLRKVWVVKTDSSGNVLWDSTFASGNSLACGTSIIQADDGSFYISANTDVGLFYHLDSLGQVISSRSYNFGNRTALSDMILCHDTTLVGAGYIQDSSGNYFAILVKLNLAGDTIWTNRFGAGMESFSSVKETGESGLIVSGVTMNYGHANGYRDSWLLKTNSMGDSLWSQTFGGTYEDAASSVIEVNDKGLIISGYTTNSGTGNDFFISKTDSLGNIVWTSSFTRPYDQYLSDMKLSKDSGLLLFGTYYDINGFSQIYLIKTDNQGIATFIVDAFQRESFPVIYPNPFEVTAQIVFKKSIDCENIHWTILNSQGINVSNCFRLVCEGDFVSLINLNKQKKGFYLMELSSSDKSFIIKFCIN